MSKGDVGHEEKGNEKPKEEQRVEVGCAGEGGGEEETTGGSQGAGGAGGHTGHTGAQTCKMYRTARTGFVKNPQVYRRVLN